MTYKLRHKFAELLKQHATKVIGIIIFLFILSKIDIKEALGIVAKMNVVYFAFVIALLFPFLLLKAYRWKILMKIQSIKFRLSSAFLIYFVGIAFGVFTPGKLGELVKLMYIKNKGHSTGKSFVSIFFDRMLDVLVLVLIGSISMLLLIEMFKNELLIIGSILAIALLFFIVFMLKKKKILKILNKTIKFFVPEKLKKRFENSFNDFIDDSRLFLGKKIVTPLIITLICWIIYFFQMYLIIISLGINIEFVYVIAAISVSILISLLPITISGIGTRDLVLVYVFAAIGIAAEQAIAFSLAILLFFVVCALIGLIAWFVKPFKIKGLNKV